jgi:hypothetical protein
LSSSEQENALGVVLFQSVQAAIRAEKILASAGIPYKLIPVPRHLSSDCGFCVRFNWPDRDRVEKLLADVNLRIDRIVPLSLSKGC